MTPQELRQHLQRQITFLRNSAAAYDQGMQEEAIRIAVVIRVLCYDKPRSPSLLKRMDQQDTIRLVTTARALPPSIAIQPLSFGELLGGMVLGKAIYHTPTPPESPTLPCPIWWEQPVYIRANERYSRKDVVLAAAHKDGGAHVDEPDDDLSALRDGFWVRVYKNADGQEVIEPLGDTHFRMLRRFADELLHSSELLALLT